MSNLRSAVGLLMVLGAQSVFASTGINLSLSPNSVTVTQASTLTIDLLNPNLTVATSAAFTDTLPSGVVIANPANATNSCGGTLTATAGTGTIQLVGGSIPAAVGMTPGRCTITVSVVSNTANTYLNAIGVGALTTSNGSNTQLTQATLAVSPVSLVTGSITYSNASVHGGAAPTTMTITLNNPNAVPLTNNAFVVSVLTNFILAGTPNFTTTCTGTPNLTGTFNNPSLVNASGLTIPASGSCVVTADIIARDPLTRSSGTITQTIAPGTLTNAEGGSNAQISGNIVVQTGSQITTKSYSPGSITSGATSIITFTVSTFNATPLTGITFTDVLPQPANGTLVIANPPAPTNNCGGDLIAVDGATQWSYGTVTPGTLAGFVGGAVGSASCTIQVTVRGTNTGMTASTVNDPTNATIWGGQGIGGTGNVFFTINPISVITGSKAFAGNTAQFNASAMNMTITLRNNTGSAVTLTSLNDDFLNTMGAGFSFSGAPGALGGTCGSTTATSTGSTSIAITGGTVPANSTCTIIVPMATTATATLGNRTNTIQANAVVTTGGNNLITLTGNVSLSRALTVGTSWNPTTVVAGTASRATITLSHQNGSQAITGIGFTDNLTATMGAGHVVATPANAATTCTGATVTANPGAVSVSVTGASLALGNTSCTVSFDVVTPVSDGSATNTIFNTSFFNDQGVLANDSAGNANAALNRLVSTVTVNNSFTPAVVMTNGASVLNIQINNNNSHPFNLTNVRLTDNLPSGLVLAASPNPSLTGTGCTPTTFTAVPGASTFTMNSATIAINAQCVLSVNVRAASAGNLVNVIPAGALLSNQGATNPSQGTATLTATGSADLSISVTDGVTQVAAGGTTTYTIVASNAGPDGIAGLEVVDNAPVGMTIGSWTCVGAGGATCPASGSGNLDANTFLPAGGTATYTVTANIAANLTGTITNTVSLIIPSGVTNTNSNPAVASDTDTVIPASPIITNPANGGTVGPNPVISGSAQPGATVTVSEGMTTVCSATANGLGAWSCNSTLQPGMHTISAIQTDSLMQVSAPSADDTFTIIPAPVVSVTTPAPIRAGNAAAYPVAGTCTTSAGTVSLSVGTVATTATCTAGMFSATVNVSGLMDGASIAVTASQTNIVGTVTDTKNTFKDSVVAAPVIASPVDGSMQSPTPAISGTSEAGATVVVSEGMTTVCTATANGSGNWSCPSTLQAGTHTITAVQTDLAGNVSAPSATDTFTIVAGAPVVTVSAPPAITSINGAAYPVTGTCTTIAGTVTISVGGVNTTTSCTAGTYSATLNVSGLADGPAIPVTASQTNTVGTSSGTTSTRKDTVANAPVIVAPGDGTTVAANPTLSGTGEAGASVTVKEGLVTLCVTTANSLGAWSCASTLGAGSHTITASQVDSVGNTSVDSSPNTFTVVTTPALLLNTPVAINLSNVATYPVSGTCTNGQGTVTVSIRTVSGTTACTGGMFSLTLDVTTVPDGAAVPVVATQGTSTDTKSTLKDTTVAAPVILNPANASTVARNPVISGTSEANAQVVVKEGMSTVCTVQANASGAWACASTLDVGSHTITATQTDSVGNVSAPSMNDTFTVAAGTALLVVVTQPTPINAGNASAYTVTGQCTSSAGAVALTVGTLMANPLCTNGMFSATLDVSTLADSAAISIAAAQTDSNGTATDTKSALKDTSVVAPVITAPVTGTTVGANPSVTGTAEPGSSITVREGTTVVCTALADSLGAWSCTTTLGAGMHTLAATQVDPAGNTSTASVTTTFTVSTAPTLVLNTPAPITGMNATAYPVSGQCQSSGGMVTVTIGTVMASTTCTSGMFSTTLNVSNSTAVPDGAAVQIVATQGSATATKSTVKDTVVAAPVILNPANGSTVATNPVISGTAEANAQVTVKEGTTTVCTVQANASGAWACASMLGVGAHTVTATQTDSVGNVSTASPSDMFTVSSSAGLMVVVTQPAIINAANASAYTVTGQCTTAAGTVTLTAGTLMATATCTAGAFTSTFNLSTLADAAAVNFSASQTDSSGTWVDTKTALKDTVVAPPVITVPTTGATVGANPSISGTSEAGAQVTVKEGTTTICTATANPSGMWACVTTITMGAHTLTATQVDVAGNPSGPSTATSVTIAAVPVVTVIAVPINAANASAYPVTGTCTNDAGDVTLIIGSSSKMTACTAGMFSTTIDVSALADAPIVTVTATQTNASGTGSDFKQVVKDTVAPAAPVITVPAAGATVASVPVISGTAVPNSSVTVTLDGMVLGTALADSNGNWTLTLTTPPAAGAHTVSAVAADAAGNVSPSSGDQTFTVQGPVVTPVVITSPASGSMVTAGESATVGGTGPANAAITVFVDGTAVGTTGSAADGTWRFDIPGTALTAGDHQVTASAAGGMASAAITLTATPGTTVHSSRFAGGGLGGCSSTGVDFSLLLVALVLLAVRRRS